MKTHQEPAKTADSHENSLQGKSINPPAFNLTAQPPVQQKSEPGLEAGGEGSMEMEGGGGGKVMGGSGMPEAVQAKMENAFGQDFSNVNIHANSSESANMGALAHAQGNDIHFAPGQYNPESQSGQELLGHELTHVVQQREGRVQPTAEVGGVAVNDQESLESEADALGSQAARGQQVASGGGAGKGGGSVQMKSAIQMKKADPKKSWNFATFKSEYVEKIDKSKLTKVEEQYFKDYAAGADLYLTRPNMKWTGKTDMTGAMFADSALRTYQKYEKDITKVIPLDFALAQAQEETHFNVNPRGSSPSKNNPMNVGEYDNSTAPWVKDIESTEQGLSMYYDLMAEDYLSTKNSDALLKDMKNENGAAYASASYVGYMSTQVPFIKKYIIGKGGAWPTMDGNVATTDTQQPKEKSQMTTLAEIVYNAMNGVGTDEEAVYGALAQLKNDNALIGQFRKVYKDTYGTDVVDDIKGDFSNTYVFGDELEKALGYLNLTSTTSAPKGAGATTTPANTRPDEKMGRVETTSKTKDTDFTASRWERTDGTKTKYATAFDEKLVIELKAEFGKDITQAEVYKMIEDAKAKVDTKKSEEYRKKLFIANQYAVVEALNVDQESSTIEGKNAMGREFRSTENHEMYGKTKSWNEKEQRWDKQTYCNIYAYDVVSAMGGYIPRLWWYEDYEKKAIEAMNQSKPYEEKVEYGKTVKEVNANSLNGWLDRCGSYFGWKKAASMDEAQKSANDGNIVILSASAKEGSGHVSVVLAERGTHLSAKVGDKTDVPLTSQAGSDNYKYGTGSKWWENSEHVNGGAWIYTAKPDSPLMKPEHIGLSGNVAATPSTGTTTTTPTTTKPATTTTKPATTTTKPTTTTTAKPTTDVGKPIGSGEVTASELFVRSGPGKDFDKVGQPLKSGEKVTIYEEKGGWYRIGQGKWASATFIKKGAATVAKPAMDFDALATRVYAAMDGVGTDEQAVYAALGLLKKDDNLIAQFMAAYQAKYKHSVVDDIKGDFSNTYLFGNELDMALGLLNIGTKPGKALDKPTSPKTNVGDTPVAGREAVVLTGSVGVKCDNKKEDVLKIQGLLTRIGIPTKVSGTCDKATNSAIYLFQKGTGLGFDGQIGATGETLKKMNATPNGAFANTKAEMDQDANAPKFTHARFDNPTKLTQSSDGMYLPEQFYTNMKTLITNVNALADSVDKGLHVNTGFRSPAFNATLDGSETSSNHQFGMAIDISSPNYTSVQLRDKVLALIKEGKMKDGGLGIYSTFIHYDVGAAGRRWDNR